MAARAKVEHMDHSPEENLRRYGQTIPPTYNYSKIEVPVHIFRGKNDLVSSSGEISNLVKLLRPGVVQNCIEVPDYNHFDFSFATDCAEKVINPIIDVVRSQESGMCK
ncbi:hypothetical protein PENTCL1PPCAC_21386 [Pristionchus entomophagus]|uniref:Hydrolase n=1 Tax=Pristionchus entomophagus TaxID=358040 RepID=A0AAV5TXL5_9BILA|nr:hypothetical protein PENTCL1PPCAC_21386 [Pristionchus entomophagus]